MQWAQISKLSREEIKNLQNKKLACFIKHEIPFSPFYRNMFKKNKISFDEIKTTDDLQKLPFTTKLDIAPTEDNPARPKQFILQPDEKLIKQYAPKLKLIKILLGKITGKDVKRKLEWEYKPVHLHFTTGRTALPTPFAYSTRDIETLKETGERMLNVAQVDRNLTALNAFPYAPHLAFWLAYHAFNKLGMTSLQTGGGKIMGTQKIIDAIERMKMGLIAFIPGYGYHIMREAVKQKRDFSSVKFVISGGERANPNLREKVKELLIQMGAKDPLFFATYAFTEGKTAWIQCCEKSGYHLYPDIEYFEVVDKNGQRVPEGSPGELVYTALDWHGSVVLRYKTGDMVEGIEYEPCPFCGKTVPRIKPDIQRSSEIKEFHLTKIKGELVNLNQFYPVLSSIKEIEEWQVEIKKKNNDPLEIDEIIIYVALKTGANFGQVKQELEKKIRDQIFISVRVEQKTLPEVLEKLGMETELKEKRIVDARPKV